ncbi:vesicle transport through interaction with t-SNAREs homolog 1A-like [Nothobranchius furzeri]|uniref:vesicle transport through interaction with t-SNAREs homolog 1A-like n=1 Tax=Nothobranchius furzeri TaxID=105023 RepID=UPI003904D3B6
MSTPRYEEIAMDEDHAGGSTQNSRATLERSSQRLEAGYQIAVETDSVIRMLITDVFMTHEEWMRARERLRETIEDVDESPPEHTDMLTWLLEDHRLFFYLFPIVIIAAVIISYYL